MNNYQTSIGTSQEILCQKLSIPEYRNLWKNPHLTIKERINAFHLEEYRRVNESDPFEEKNPSNYIYHVTSEESAKSILKSKTLGIPMGTRTSPNISCNLYAGFHATKKPPSEIIVNVLKKRSGSRNMVVLRMSPVNKIYSNAQIEKIDRYAPIETPIILELVEYLKNNHPQILEIVKKNPTKGTFKLGNNRYNAEIIKENQIATRVMVDSFCSGFGNLPNFAAYSDQFGIITFMPEFLNQIAIQKTGSHNYIVIPGTKNADIRLVDYLELYHTRLLKSEYLKDSEYVLTWNTRYELFKNYYFNYSFDQRFLDQYWFLWPSENRLGFALRYISENYGEEISFKLNQLINNWFFELLLKKQKQREFDINIPAVSEPVEVGSARDGFLIITKPKIIFNTEIFQPNNKWISVGGLETGYIE